MPWTEEQVDELIKQVRRDFALERVTDYFDEKLLGHGVTLRQAEAAIGKHSYIGRYRKDGTTIGFWDKRNRVFVAWKTKYPTRVKTCFIVKNGLDYFRRQNEFELLWSPK
jgi:hypothetical protein